MSRSLREREDEYLRSESLRLEEEYLLPNHDA
jgi:hypothetical protein